METLERREVLASTPIISEFLAANSGGLRDSYGESSDWIEIYNPTAADVNLQGWSLTDRPSDLNRWTFPEIIIGANQYLTVFASDRNITTGPELHTNFALSADGEYLALVNSSGIVVSEYTPAYPPQLTNVSYGVGFDTAKLVESGASAQVLVPNNDSLGNTWTATSFSSTGWTSGTTGVGYGIVHPGFNILYGKANVTVADLGVARNVRDDPGLRPLTVNTTATVINYMGTGGGGRFGSDFAFPTQSIGDDINDFIVSATGTVTIPTAGPWTFAVNSDDGFELRVERPGTVFTTEHFNPRGASDTLATFNIPVAGDWNISALMYERGGGASFELFAAPGSHGSYNTTFRLVGDVAAGGLTITAPLSAGSTVTVGTDVRTAMQNVNATAYVRIPFTVANPAAYDSLQLAMQYDDGFVAYLNGVEVARRNAPTTVAYNSAATVDRTLVEATAPESINLTPHLNLLQSGNNVLAIRGLNSSIGDDSFLVLPQLVASAVHTDQLRFFSTPTPGGPNVDPALGVIDRVTANVAAGFYTDPISVTLATASPGATIRYTTNGSTPTATNGVVYTGPIAISSTTTLRAGAFRTDYLPHPTITRSYMFVDDVIYQSPSDDVAGGYPDVGAPPPGWPASWGINVVDYGMDQTIINQAGPETVKAALLSMRTISITTDLDNLFHPTTGIYANAREDGRDWERPASVELLNPDGSAGFQVNAGVRMRGGYSRSPDNPKHSFRLFFRGEYGDATVEYPLFGAEGVSSFKKFDLRTAQNYSWSFGGDASNTMIQDGFARLSQGEMGQAYTRSIWVHLYLNGQYWGIFQIQERPEAEYAASYFGGEAANYDVIKPEAGPYTNNATDGNQDAYQRLWQYVTTQNLANNATYYHIQGKNALGVDDPLIPNEDVLVDVDNLIVYMLGILHGGNLDAPISNFLGNNGVNNYYAIRDRTGRSGFKFIQHDAEHTLRNVNENRNGPYSAGQTFDRFNPQFLHQQLMANAEYRLKFADLVQRFFFTSGPMTAAAALQRFESDVVKLDPAIVAESARWGDAKRPTSPLGYANWLNALNSTRNFLTNRNAVMLAQFQAIGLFPSLAAPQYLINGMPQWSGEVEPGSILRKAAPSGVVYFMTDGSDPRLPGGGIHPEAVAYDPSSTQVTLLAAGSSWKYFDQGVDLGTSWRGTTFNDSAWASGQAELGYGEGDETTVVSYGPNANNKYITTYFRRNFEVTQTDGLTGLTLRLKRDDGAVIYINGVEAARSNMPAGPVTYSTLASAAVGGADESTFFEINIDPSLLSTGTNLIAVELHQSAVTSSDLSFDASLEATVHVSAGLVLNSPTRVLARTFSGGTWSALAEANFTTNVVPAAAGNLVVKEIHYNPLPMAGASAVPFNDAQNFEFLEFQNIGSTWIDLAGVQFTSGLTYEFSSGDVTYLAPGEHLVLVKNRLAFEARYGTSVVIGGIYDGNLANGGERLRFVGATGSIIQDFSFDDDPDTMPPWPITPDGDGPSLTVRSVTADYNLPANWRASYLLHGTPGYEENDYPASISLSNASVLENTLNAVVGALSATDPNSGDTLTLSLFDSAGGRFAISDGNLVVAPGIRLEHATQSTYSITVRATDAGGLTLDKVFTITVIPLSTFQTTTVTPISTGVIVNFNRSLDVSTLNLYDLQGGTLGAADITLVGAAVGNIRGSVVVDPNLRRLTFIRTTGVLPPDTYTLTLRSAANGLRDTTGELLDGDANGVAGGNYASTFIVNVPAGNTVALSIANFARGPQQPVNIPANGTSGLPVSFSNGGGITSANFQLRYDPALLNITGATVAAGLSGATVNVNTSTPGIATIQFSSPTPLAAGPTQFIHLQASVLTTATYRSKHVLDLTNIELNGGAIPAIDDDAIHVVAYFGDSSGNGTYGAQDASRIARISVGLDGGLEEFTLLDHTIITDISGNGSVTSGDVSRMLQASVAFAVPEIPPMPSPAISLTYGGPDPKLSIPTDLVATAGGRLQIPVMIDSIVDLTGDGLESADLVLYFDAAALEVSSVSLGSLLVGHSGHWVVASRIDSLEGRIFVSLAGTVPLEGFFLGELVTLNATVKTSAPAGPTAINLAASARDPSRFTQLNEGYLTLIPAPTNAANDPGVDGLLTILPQESVRLPKATLLDNHLVIVGTSGDDQFFLNRINDHEIGVRVNRTSLGRFPANARVELFGLEGNDQIVVGNVPGFEHRNAIVDPSGALLEREFSNRGHERETDAEVNSLQINPAGPVNTPQDLALLQLIIDLERAGLSSSYAAGKRLRIAGRR